MRLWWLSASAAELDTARTCRECGCKDADIDLGLCFDCFKGGQAQEQYPEPTEREYREHYGLPTDDLDEPTKGADRE